MTWEWVAFTLVAGTFVLILAAIFAMMLDKTQRNRTAREEARARSTVEELQEALEAERRRVTQTGGHRPPPAPEGPKLTRRETDQLAMGTLSPDRLREVRDFMLGTWTPDPTLIRPTQRTDL